MSGKEEEGAWHWEEGAWHWEMETGSRGRETGSRGGSALFGVVWWGEMGDSQGQLLFFFTV